MPSVIEYFRQKSCQLWKCSGFSPCRWSELVEC